MKVVIAPDSFKESLSAEAVAAALAEGVRKAFPNAEIVTVPMADGGEGTVAAVLAAAGGELRSTQVTGPLGTEVTASWGWLANTRAAVIEMAEASGLHLVPVGQRDATRTSTYGTGQLVQAALQAGAHRIIMGFGGSATNDGGVGMLQALGAKFLCDAGTELQPGGLALQQLARIDLSGVDSQLQNVRFEVACDVDNPLTGEKGASHVFGPQKGATPSQVRELDSALGVYADIAASLLGKDVRNSPGAGAAGGIGFAAKAFLNASFRPGVQLIAELAGLAEVVKGADLVITGEGKLDQQTFYGKTPAGVAAVAKAAGVPTIAIAGTLGEGYQLLREIGICAAFSITSGPMTIEHACTNAADLLSDRAFDVMNVWALERSSS